MKNKKRLLGATIAVASFVCIGAHLIEPRLGLLIGGFLMFLITDNPSGWFAKVVETMGNTDFLKVILPAFAFASVAQATGCTQALASVLATPFAGRGLMLIPIAVLAAFLTNSVLISANASALVIGFVFQPILAKAGINPALGAAAILAGSWGAVLNPGSQHATLIAQAASQPGRTKVEPMDVVRGHTSVVLIALAIVMGLMWLEAVVFHGAGNPVADKPGAVLSARAWLRAPVPLIPLVLLWIIPKLRIASMTRWFDKKFLVLQVMLIGILVAIIAGTSISLIGVPECDPENSLEAIRGRVTQAQVVAPPPTASVSQGQPIGTTTPPTGDKTTSQPNDRVSTSMSGRKPVPRPRGYCAAEAIFASKGLARGYGEVMTMIIAAMVFVAGLEELQVLRAFLDLLKRQRRGAGWFAFFGDMGFAAVSGSGDAASAAFNRAVTPEAKNLGERPRELGSMAWLGAEMGRCLAPFAVVTISLADNFADPDRGFISDANQVVKWTVLPILVAGLIAVLIRRTIKE